MKKIQKIVLASDFSKCAKKAHALAMEMRDKLKCHLEIIHVFDVRVLNSPAPYPYNYVPDWLEDCIEENRKRGKKALKELEEELKADKSHFLEGVPYLEIEDFVNEHKIDLLVIGTHGYAGFKRLLMGSVAEYTTRCAKCPVLIAKS